jgi:hypothetical protein
MKKILVVTCSKDNGEQSQLVQSLAELKDDVKIIVNSNNTTGLSKCYNKQIVPDNLIDHDIILFVHDDVFIDDLKLKGKLYTAVNDLKYDIVGLAGAREIKVSKPALWHLMSRRESWTGSVAHPVNNSKQLMTTSFGPWPSRCLILDGLFLAINLRNVLKSGWRFNEKYDFHHYDIASCLDANDKKLRIGTYPIYTTHMSPGLTSFEDKSFMKSQKQFITDYATKTGS